MLLKPVTNAAGLEQTREGIRVKSTKNRKARIFSLPASAVQALSDHQAAQREFAVAVGPDYRADLGLVFGDEYGDYRKPNSVTSTACRIAEKAGYKGVSLHNLRHGHGSQLLSAGVPLPTVSARLGHSSPYVTATIYSHALKLDELEAADKWETAMVNAKANEAIRLKD